MKKLLAMFLFVTLAMSLVCAAGMAEAETLDEGPVTIRYWQHSSAARDEMMKKIVTLFEAENPNITVELEFIPQNDYTQKLIPSLATATAPDVFQVQSGMVQVLAEAGSIQSLDERVISTQEIQDAFVPATVDGLKYAGSYYGMPTDTQTIMVFWNNALVKAAGLDSQKGPQTWDEFFNWARLLTKTGTDGKMTQSGWGGKGYWPEVAAYVDQMGGRFYDEATQTFVFADDPKSVQAFRTMSDLYIKDKVYDLQFAKNWAGFRQGLVAVMMGHPAMIGNLVTTAPNLDYSVGLIPGNGKNHNTCVTSWAYVMSAKAPSVAASKFIRFLGSEKIERMWTTETGELPARKSLLADPSLAANAKVAVALSSLNDSFVGRLQTGGLNTVFTDYYQRILLTAEPLEQILKALQKALNEELALEL
ncbi:MAG: ABC transporter substrate-binding protein [Sphaerochaetaceae bacterium]